MVRGELGVRTITTSSGAAAMELIAPGGQPAFLRRLTVSMAAATASSFGIGIPAAIGVTPTSPVRLLGFDGSGQAMFESKVAVAWGTPPTAPNAFYRRFTLAAAIGDKIILELDYGKGLYIPAASSLVLWNLAANGVVDVTVEVDE